MCKTNEDIGARIRNLRKTQSLTQSQLAEKAEVSTHFISDIENANRSMSVPVLLKICQALSTNPNYILLGECDASEGIQYEFNKLEDEKKKIVLEIIIAFVKSRK